MSVQEPADVNPSRVEIVMTNHLDQTMGAPTSEHVNGVTPSLGELGKQDSSESVDPKPKSTFKITSVTLHRQKGGSQDGRHSFGEEDEESAVEDSLVPTDAEESPAPLSNFADIIKQQQPHQKADQRSDQRQDRVDSTSRFKVVKIQKRKPYNIGRWRISDFMSAEHEPSSTKVQDVNNHMKHSSESGNSSRASSTHYVHGVDDPSKNPLANINSTTAVTANTQPQASIQSQSKSHAPTPGYISTIAQQDGSGQIDRGPAPTQPHLNNYNNINDKLDITNIGGENIGTQVLSPQDGHNVTNSAVASGQPVSTATALTNRVLLVGTQLPANPSNQIPQHTGLSTTDQTSTAPVNTQNTTQTQAPVTNGGGGGGAVHLVPLSTLNNPNSPPAINEYLKAPADEVQGDTRSKVNEQQQVQTQLAQETPFTQEHFGGVEALAANLTELVDPAAVGADGEQPDNDAAATGVAIDNKIEQAMDLVKSHLMLAVREEVEDLKLQINKLIERNNQLEQENKLLRSSAAPETMAQLALLNRQQNH